MAPRRFTDATVTGEPKDGWEEDAASGTEGDTATAVEDAGVADPGEQQGSAAAARTSGEAPAEETADVTAPAPGGRRSPRRRPRRPRTAWLASDSARRPMLVLSAAFAVLVVALAAIAVKLGLGLAAQQRQQADQQAALHAARQAAADLMTVNYHSASSDINRILGVATGSFHNQVAGARQQLVKQTVNAQAVSKANVLEAGLVGGQVNGNTATAIVVVDSTITSKNAPNGVVNHYRETITLSRSGGRWLASQVNFATPGGGQ